MARNGHQKYDRLFGCHNLGGIFLRMCFRAGRYLHKAWAMHPERQLPFQVPSFYQYGAIPRQVQLHSWLQQNLIQPVYTYCSQRYETAMDVLLPPFSVTNRGILFECRSRSRWVITGKAEYAFSSVIDRVELVCTMRAPDAPYRAQAVIQMYYCYTDYHTLYQAYGGDLPVGYTAELRTTTVTVGHREELRRMLWAIGFYPEHPIPAMSLDDWYRNRLHVIRTGKEPEPFVTRLILH